MKRRVMALTAAAIFVSPAAALADVKISAVDGTAADNQNHHWDPATPTVKVGELVTWTFAGTANSHNLKSDSANWDLATSFAVAGPDVTQRFTAPGTYSFICQLHTLTMKGSVTVTDEAGTLPPPPPPPPLSAQPFLNDLPAPSILEVRDTIAPKLDRVAVTRVRTGARVRLRLSEAGKVTVKLTRSGQKAKTRTVTVRKGTSSVTVDGLRKGTYRVQISAKDLAGNKARTTKSARVTVRS